MVGAVVVKGTGLEAGSGVWGAEVPGGGHGRINGLVRAGGMVRRRVLIGV